MQRLDAKTIKPGFRFKNNSMRLTVVLCGGTDKHNLALLVRENDACPLNHRPRPVRYGKRGFRPGVGHYFSDFDEALEDYRERLSELP